jgi:hypothetical protein
VLLLVLAAGPYFADVAVLVDLIGMVGLDVLLLSIAIYNFVAVREWLGVRVAAPRAWILKRGVLMPTRATLRAPAVLVGHNLERTITPLVFASFAAMAFAVVALLNSGVLAR